ncbi:signal peptidase I [Patescibacteria group bacterium]|nr:signal peptidase I [Patescibacteria group bacterium]
MKTVLKTTEWLVFTLTIVFILMVVSPILPTKNSFATYVVSSNSMYPSIEVGSVIIVSGVKPSNININDVIAFSNPNDDEQTIVHRVIEKRTTTSNENILITKGDNNDIQDNWEVPESLVKGKRLLTIPKLGILIESLKTAKGFALFLGLPALILLGFQIKKIKEGINEEILKRTDEEVKKRETKITTLLTLSALFFLILQLFSSPQAYGLFSSTVTISGISLEIGSNELEIDIKPGNPQNPINLKSNGVIQVSVLGSEYLDVNDIKFSSVVFMEAEPVKWNFRKVNKDNYEDIVFFFNVSDLEGIEKTTQEGRLDLENKDGVNFYGTDMIWVIHEDSLKNTESKNGEPAEEITSSGYEPEIEPINSSTEPQLNLEDDLL